MSDHLAMSEDTSILLLTLQILVMGMDSKKPKLLC